MTNTDDDTSGLIRSIIRRRARKQYVCSACYMVINIGDPYEYFTGITQVRTGHYFTTRRCRGCVDNDRPAVVFE